MTDEPPSHTPTQEPPDLRTLLHAVPGIGLTVLYEPPEGVQVVADIVFVHGLGGHPVETWAYGNLPKQERKGEGDNEAGSKSGRGWWGSIIGKRKRTTNEGAITSKPQYVYWPKQLLPCDFPNVRVLTYGYDSHPSHFYQSKTTQMNTTQHKEDLMMSVTNERSGCPGRPLFFVAHSLGGILVKGAITESLDMEEQLDLQDLGRSCRAIFFFGTPHFGANSAAYATIVSNIIGSLPGTFSTNDEILRGLSPDSEVLYAINRDFNKLLNQNIEHARKIQIYCFQEGQGMTSVKGFSGKVSLGTQSS